MWRRRSRLSPVTAPTSKQQQAADYERRSGGDGKDTHCGWVYVYLEGECRSWCAPYFIHDHTDHKNSKINSLMNAVSPHQRVIGWASITSLGSASWSCDDLARSGRLGCVSPSAPLDARFTAHPAFDTVSHLCTTLSSTKQRLLSRAPGAKISKGLHVCRKHRAWLFAHR